MTRPRTDAGRGHGGALGRVAAVALALLTGVPQAHAQEGAPGHARCAVVAVLAGSAQPVARMADYQWDIRPHAAWGAQLLAGTGPVAAGLRFWRSGTTQALGLAGVADPAVHATSLELVGRARLARWRSVRCLALASAGRLAITWSPDRATVVSGGTPVEVTFTPVHEWVGGAGLAVEVPFAMGWSWSVETERRAYSLDTAHRQGAAVIESRDRFGDWAARVALARSWDW